MPIPTWLLTAVRQGQEIPTKFLRCYRILKWLPRLLHLIHTLRDHQIKLTSFLPLGAIAIPAGITYREVTYPAELGRQAHALCLRNGWADPASMLVVLTTLAQVLPEGKKNRFRWKR